MKTQKFKVNSWSRIPRDRIDIKEEVFLVLSDRRYLNLLSSNAQADVIDKMTFDQYKKFLKKNKKYNIYKKEVLKEKKLKELQKTNYLPIKGDAKKALRQALNLLNVAFTLNKNVKKKAYHTEYGACYHCDHDSCICGEYAYAHTTVNYTLRDSEYAEKTKIIKKVINLIKNNLLPIKYGKNDGIVYFEYLGSQVSFHDPKNQINCKKFNGTWTGVPNKKIPFPFLTNSK
jgi:hypothetical protein